MVTIKKILLINPFGSIPYYALPLSLGYLKSNLGEGLETTMLDCSFRGIDANSTIFAEAVAEAAPDLVGITGTVQTNHQAVRAAEVIKGIRPDTITCLGGPYCSTLPHKVLACSSVDYVFQGEGEVVFSEFVRRMNAGDPVDNLEGLAFRANGEIVRNPIHIEKDLDSITIPDYHFMDLDGYIKQGYNYGGFFGRTAAIWLTRGCPYGCRYCSAPLINGRKVRHHSLEYATEWVTRLYQDLGVTQITIVDDNFTFVEGFAKEFCRTMISLQESRKLHTGMRFATPNGVRLEKLDEELLALMKRAGWSWITIAPESGSPAVLKRMHKQMDPTMVPGLVEMIKKAGLNVRGFFMMGYPGETRADLRMTQQLIRKSRFDIIQIGRFNPIPGTPEHEALVAAGEIPEDYNKDGAKANLGVEPDLYSPPEVRNINCFRLTAWESCLMAFRNPRSALAFLRYFGVMNLLKKSLQIRRLK